MSKNMDEKMLVHFEDNKIRRVWDEEEQKWYFSVSDIVGALSDSKDSKSYWRQLKRREPQLVTFCHGFKLVAADGKRRLEDCTDTKGILRIIQSIPSATTNLILSDIYQYYLSDRGLFLASQA